jgi:hypothetical protein
MILFLLIVNALILFCIVVYVRFASIFILQNLDVIRSNLDFILQSLDGIHRKLDFIYKKTGNKK